METAEWQGSDEAGFLCTEYTKVRVGLVHFVTQEEGKFLTPTLPLPPHQPVNSSKQGP